MARGGWHYMPASIQACSAIHRGLPWLMSSANGNRTAGARGMVHLRYRPERLNLELLSKAEIVRSVKRVTDFVSEISSASQDADPGTGEGGCDEARSIAVAPARTVVWNQPR
jgi:hypothetical protein